MRFVIIPGIDGSDAEHWQSLWEAEWGHRAVRIAPASWSEPAWEDWQDAIDSAVTEARTTDLGEVDGPAAESAEDAAPTNGTGEQPVVLMAHSLGCLAAAAWMQAHPGAAVGFLVAVPDPAGPCFPAAAAAFGVAAGSLGSAAVVVASTDDPYARTASSRQVAERWGASWVGAGAVGHISSGSSLGAWPRGRELLQHLLDGTLEAPEPTVHERAAVAG